MRHTISLTAVVATASLFFVASPSLAATLQGVTAPDTIQVDAKPLRLQGLGLRKKAIFSVYVGALYLTTPTSDGAAATRADEPKRIALTFLRDLDGATFREALEDGFFKNAQERLSALRPKIDALHRLASVDVKKGQELSFTYLPGVGTRVALAGTVRGVVEGKDLMEALFSVWLGEVPPSHDLKKGMLGRP